MSTGTRSKSFSRRNRHISAAFRFDPAPPFNTWRPSGRNDRLTPCIRGSNRLRHRPAKMSASTAAAQASPQAVPSARACSRNSRARAAGGANSTAACTPATAGSVRRGPLQRRRVPHRPQRPHGGLRRCRCHRPQHQAGDDSNDPTSQRRIEEPEGDQRLRKRFSNPVSWISSCACGISGTLSGGDSHPPYRRPDRGSGS